MSKKRLNRPKNSDLDKTLQEYLKQLESFGIEHAENVHTALPTPKISGEVRKLSLSTHNRILEAIRPASIKSLCPQESSDKERVSVMSMTTNFQNLYGKEACKLLTSLEPLFEKDGRFITEDLALVIEVLREFFGRMDCEERIDAVKIALAINPGRLNNVLELSGLLYSVKEWLDQTQPNLIALFIEKEIVEKDFSEEERQDLSVQELEECQLFFSEDIRNLLKTFNDVLRKYGEVVGDSYMRIYFDDGKDRAEKFLKMIRLSK